jgi:hypothetical protein
MSAPTMIDLFVSNNSADWKRLLAQNQVYNRTLLKNLPKVVPTEFDKYLHEKLKPHDQPSDKYFYESVLNLPEIHYREYRKHKQFSHFVRSTPVPARTVYFRDVKIPEYIWREKMGEILSKIPGIQYTWDGKNFQWRVEPLDIIPPPEYGKSLQEQVIMRHRRVVSYEAAILGHRFAIRGNQLLCKEILDVPVIQSPSPTQWGRVNVCMFADKRGIWVDGVSPHGFMMKIVDMFHDLFEKLVVRDRLFLTRLSYLRFVDSITDEDYDNSNPVHRYIFDQYVCQEICSYF